VEEGREVNGEGGAFPLQVMVATLERTAMHVWKFKGGDKIRDRPINTRNFGS